MPVEALQQRLLAIAHGGVTGQRHREDGPPLRPHRMNERVAILPAAEIRDQDLGREPAERRESLARVVGHEGDGAALLEEEREEVAAVGVWIHEQHAQSGEHGHRGG